jgi:two-component system chemotaxis response regulator CheB
VSEPVKVLIVDDSAVARDLLERGLSLDPGITIVGKASDAFSARDKIVLRKPDVVTLDVEMPRMDGIEFLRRLLPQYPIPVVVVSAVTAEGSRRALEALEAGAVGVVGKPSSTDRDALKNMLLDLAERIKEAAKADVSKLRTAGPLARRPRAPTGAAQRASSKPRVDKLIAIGASTGGTQAIRTIVSALPPEIPPTLVVQHMPPVFTRMFAESLAKESRVEVREAANGDLLRPGLVLVAPGDLHLRLVKASGGWIVRCETGPKVCGHRPSVDVLFNSVAAAAGPRAVGIILTGMGKDGAEGLLAMRRAGSRCLAQDAASSVVFGMPKEAWDRGAAERLVPIDGAVEAILACLDDESATEAGDGR